MVNKKKLEKANGHRPQEIVRVTPPRTMNRRAIDAVSTSRIPVMAVVVVMLTVGAAIGMIVVYIIK